MKIVSSLKNGTMAVLSFFIFNCATIKIDVDVYKGPLANHEQIQTQQMAVMAIGTKPLLIQLRDHLQNGKDPSNEINNQKWYRSGYVAPYQEGGMFKSHFTDDNAKRVNAILSLYDDRKKHIPDEANYLLQKGLQSYAKYLEALNILRPLKTPEETRNANALWLKLKEHMREEINAKDLDNLQKTLGLIPEGLSKAKEKSNLKEINKIIFSKNGLKTTYENYVKATSKYGNAQRSWRDQEKIFDANRQLKESIENLNKGRNIGQIQTSSTVKSKLAPKKPTGEPKQTSGAPVAKPEPTPDTLVAEPEPTNDATVAGPKQTPIESANAQFKTLSKKKFLENQSFILYPISEKSARKTFIKEMETIARSYLNAREEIVELFKISLKGIKGLKLADRQKFSGVEDLEEVGAKLATELISDHQMIKAFDELQNQAMITDLVSTFKSKLAKLITYEKFKSDAELFRYTLVWLLSKDNGDVAEILLDLHNKLEAFNKPGYMYGLTVGPSDEHIIGTASDLNDTIEKIGNIVLLGFERGRLSDGLETLIENYLEKSDMYSPQSEKNSKIEETIAKKKLLNGLVRFSVKVLAIADNHGLLQQKNSTKDENIDRYITVLQAIGNSIKIQTNELLYRDSHDIKLVNYFGRERLGLRLAYQDNPARLLDSVVSFIVSDTGALDKTLEEYSKGIKAVDFELNGDEDDNKKKGLITQKNELDTQIRRLKENRMNLEKAHSKYVEAEKVSLFFPKRNGIPDLPKNPKKIDVWKNQFHTFLGETIWKKQDKEKVEIIKSKIEIWFNKKVIAERTVSEKEELNKIRDAYVHAHKESTNSKTEMIYQLYYDKIQKYLNGQMENSSEGEANYSTELGSIKQEEEKERANSGILEEKIKTAEAKRKQLTKSKKIRGAANAINDSKSEILYKIESEKLALTGYEILRKVRAYLKKKMDDSDIDEEESYFQYAINEIAKYPVPLEPPISATTESKTSKDVLDDVIALLRQEYLKVSRESGPTSVQATRLKATLEEAYEQRSGMVYIRPVAPYLRSSFTAAFMQNDPGLTWQNMLNKHALRSTPIIGGALYRESEGITKDKVKILGEIDKQFWQNINRVRVSGAGRTNYVIAKDDIGNWYVKNYSADPEPIIKGAESLAAFGLSGVFNANLLGQVQAARPGGTAGVGPAQPPAGMIKVLNRFEREYMDQTRVDLNDVIDMLIDTDADTNTYDSKVTQKIRQQLLSNTAISAKKEEVNASINTAGRNTLENAYTELKDKKVDKDRAEDKIKEIKGSVTTNPNKVIVSLLDEIKQDIYHPKRNARIMAGIERKLVVRDDKKLNDNLAELKVYLGDPEPGNRIIDGLHALRRFHNQLNPLIANIDFTTGPKKTVEVRLETLDKAKLKTQTAEDELNVATARLKDAEDPNTEYKDVTNAKTVVNDKKIKHTAAETTQASAKKEYDNALLALKAAEGANTAAQITISATIKGMLDTLVDKRDQTVSDYEERVVFLGEVVK